MECGPGVYAWGLTALSEMSVERGEDGLKVEAERRMIK
jgi:hypothetical protein